jgi:hypothetical protein
MIFDDARPFEEALESRQAKTILPTTLRTRDLARLSPEIRESAMFSAAVTDARFLGTADAVIEDILTGRISLADGRVRIDQYLNSVGYGGEVLSTDLTDLRSLARKNVLLETNVGLALGYGQWKQGQHPVTLNMWPAQELIRVENRREPRENWPARFKAAGGTEWNGRLIALTNSDVWTFLSRFGYPYPPFDFNSGMGVRAVSRADAVAAGLLDEDEDMVPETRGLEDAAQANLRNMPQGLRTAVAEQLAGIAEFDGDVLRKLAPDFSQNAASLGLPQVSALRAPRNPPAARRDMGQHALAQLNAGVEVADPTGRPVRLDRETMAHWKMTPDELARIGHLGRAIDTLQDPVEVWDQGTQRVYINLYQAPDRAARAFMVFVRPSGQVDNYFTSKLQNVEKNRRGRERVYAAQ